MNRRLFLVIAALAVSITMLFAYAAVGSAQELVVYAGRSEALIGPLFDRFTQETGIRVSVRYGGTSELAATILEEGRHSPADVFWAQDAGALGALAKEGRLSPLPASIMEKIADPRLRSPENLWVATSGRARVIAYSTERLTEADLPETIWGFTDPKWKGRIGWPPTNASFQTFVTALRVLEGEERAREWLEGIKRNNPRVYPNNASIVDAISRGEIDVGFVNHYYLYRFLAEQGDAFPVRNYHTKGDAGSIINVAGAGILDTAKNREAAEKFIAFLLSPQAQAHFAGQTFEYPVATGSGVELDPRLVPLDEIDTADLDLTDLDDMAGTLELIQSVGIL